ncbi:MAG TPA: hypothetical protein DGT21_00680 [Armatimonadetes bacterium]|jgi:serine protease Do|nr:hypothetical protein [Armatimonadota bacterium]
MSTVFTTRFIRALIVLVVLGVISGGWVLYGLEKAHDAGVQITTSSPAVAQAINQSAITSAAKKAVPSVVAVASKKTTKAPANPFADSPFQNDPFFRRFFGDIPDQPRERVQRGLGSGVIVSADGYILTNAHVISGADEIKVAVDEGREYDAKIVGVDEGSDVGVLKIEATGLPAMPFGNSDEAEVGEIVLAIGSPYELGGTVTMGIISATGRAELGITDYGDFIQTDAAINPGNSGGALINMNGELVGINTAIFTRTGGYQGIGFAIPANLARRVMDSLVEHGEVARGWLGVVIGQIDENMADQLGLGDTKGVVVSEVTEGSPSEQAGVREYDVIVRVNGRAVNSPAELRSVVGTTQPGAKVELDIIRDGKPLKLAVTIGKAPADAATPAAGADTAEGVEIVTGLWATDITPQVAEKLQIPPNTRGIAITRTDAEKLQASMALQAGDLILQINRQGVTSVAQAQQAIKGSRGDAVLLLVRRGNVNVLMTVKK